MATVTPNFNWPVPTSTDLVKDGATAIEALGDSIDASLVDLKGGTTGQVLSKTSNTDMDFTWVAQDDSNAIQNSIVDAKGDLIAASAADTPARLAVGSDGETLVADSSTSTGLRYQAPRSFNYIINGGMDISQRGTSFVPTSGIYTLDRWFGQRYGGAGGTITQVNTSDTTNLPQITKAMRIANNAGTGTNNTNVFNSLESSQTQQLLGQTVTLSFYLRKGANYSGADFTVSLIGGTGTDQSLNSGYTGQATLATVTAVPSTTWTRYQTTLTLGSTYTQLGLVIVSKAVGTSGANDWAEITGVQLELGSIATTFQRSGGTIQGELAACQRYYYRTSTANTDLLTGGFMDNGTIKANVFFPSAMRTTPTFGSNVTALSGGAAPSTTQVGAYEFGVGWVGGTTVTNGSTGVTPSIGSLQFAGFSGTNKSKSCVIGVGSSVYLEWSAEL